MSDFFIAKGFLSTVNKVCVSLGCAYFNFYYGPTLNSTGHIVW